MNICIWLLVLAMLPFFLLREKKNAVPSKKSDWFGYGAILLWVLVVVGLAFAVIR